MVYMIYSYGMKCNSQERRKQDTGKYNRGSRLSDLPEQVSCIR